MLKRIIIIISLFIILATGFVLRKNNYQFVPFPGESLDEYSNAWMGLSLIRLGVPVGISGLSGYSQSAPKYINVDRIFQGEARGVPMAISYPWFDHPPLMGLVSGGFAYLQHARIFEDATINLIRKPMLVLGAITIFLVFWLALEIFDLKTALVAAALYATSPVVVVSSRMVQAENGMIVFALMALILLKKWPKKVWMAGLVAGIGILFKLSGIFILIAGLFLGGGWQFIITTAIIASGFGIYGLVLDAKTFFNIFFSNVDRAYGIGFHALYELFTSTKITGTKFLTDGWPLVGWLGLSAALANQEIKRYKWVVVPLLSYLAVYLLQGSEAYGWYRIPFMPFLFILAAALITARSGMWLMLIPLGVNLNKIILWNQQGQYTGLWKWGIAGLVLLIIPAWFGKNSWWSKIIMFLLFISVLWSNIAYNNIITIDYWYKAF